MALPFISSNKNKVGSVATKTPAHDSTIDLLKAEAQAEKAPAPVDISYLARPSLKPSSEFKVSAEAYALSRV
ncbi:hypothetical protein DFQ26_000983 [Actinomortierella ambigua]|nr:hypothetical protein DFQ26_000983 [Actinomortierella ambigua]